MKDEPSWGVDPHQWTELNIYDCTARPVDDAGFNPHA